MTKSNKGEITPTKAGACDECGKPCVGRMIQKRERGFRNRSMTFTRMAFLWCNFCRDANPSRWRYAR